ncbi:MAG TPA: zinc metalloprotease HtpX [Candidatus Limnocylindrales bacterium]|nr:zinc metalloprotease HtpX [Candidatus Limnocylindrales bacterium]
MLTTNRFTNHLKTWLLLAALGGLLVLAGGALGGTSGMTIALGLAVALNLFVYWKSDSIALAANGARPLAPGELPAVERIVRDLAGRAGIPMPRLYVIERPEPNAFATGRSPSHAAVAVTSGILELMDERQLRGVLAHELSHVANRDTLVGTIAATIGAAISWLAQMAQFSMFFGGREDEESGAGGLIGTLALMILAPIAALIIQLAVSRSREFLADASGAALTQDPEGLATALERLESANEGMRGVFARLGRRPQPVPAATAHLYTVTPLSGQALGSLFSTHPPIADRVRRLRAMAGGAWR